MNLVKLKLENFRAYENIEVTFDHQFNVIVGKNDVGKSTLLEALEIFFNNETIKLDVNDCNVYAAKKEVSIQASFSIDDKKYTIDTIPTDLTGEFLLDKEGLLSIKKTWDCSKDKITASSLKTFLVANYPEYFEVPLISEKITDLKKHLEKYADQIDVDVVKKNTSSEIRKAIYGCISFDSFSEREIPIDKEDGKKIWDSLRTDLPAFFLFRSDRENRDSDKEVQDPLKAITKTAISQLEDELNLIKNEIQQKALDIGRRTIEKLREMNPEIAEVLIPEMATKSWDSLFSFTFSADDGIPLNKRGSGVRRLILLNYFRAEAELQNSAVSKNIIYAIEEPETSQHPDWQIELVNSLIELSARQNTKVIITTHSPALASMANPEQIIFIYKEGSKVIVEGGADSNMDRVVATLGLMPNLETEAPLSGVKLALCLEGPTDIEFFYGISPIFGVDIKNDPKIMAIPLGGSTLQHWVNKSYLSKLNLYEVHIYDSDVEKYKQQVDVLNQKPRAWASQTKMFEIENYIHPQVIKSLYGLTDEEFFKTSANWQLNWGTFDVPRELAEFLKIKGRLGGAIKNSSEGKIKKYLNAEGAKLMTQDLFDELGASNEIKIWFEKIIEFRDL
ncbi:hypothetical protein A9236_02510 [Polynucleobacter sp. QLW-P1DATA-2]|uniref:ATP-binding protein n=1 Tax=unclassified Polynucleobacter TaxID=2640945 RepID=UPI0008F9241E|nr:MULTISPECIES: ATP-binding protein [unclassified Polynucleobacter]OIN03008.1 hypothetical protein A9236_02510 [Polynucleobacter sp. QLW-P1DATA-2]OIN03031.1 hypothetical protein A9235_00010 [Polynucleobacter sp. MWH-Tro8-2-5-gr]